MLRVQGVVRLVGRVPPSRPGEVFSTAIHRAAMPRRPWQCLHCDECHGPLAVVQLFAVVENTRSIHYVNERRWHAVADMELKGLMLVAALAAAR